MYGGGEELKGIARKLDFKGYEFRMDIEGIRSEGVENS
jgi:hypothetical protein